MRSATLRVIVGAIALLAIGVAGFLLFRSEKQIDQRALSLRVVDQRAREAADALAEARVAQHGYVAAGQGELFWMSKVSAAMGTASTALDALRQSAHGVGQTAADRAAAMTSEFAAVDKRVREYLASGQQLMASDVIFTEGSDAAADAGRQVEAVRLAEHQAFDRDVAAMRRQQAMTIGAAATAVALVVLLLIPVRREPEVVAVSDPMESATDDDAVSEVVASAPIPMPVLAPAPAPVLAPQTEPSMFRAAADIATDFGRVRDLEELSRILGRAADLLDASGLMVWVGDTAGGDLRPALSHGYSSQMLARIPPVRRTADNAAAKAYRSGALQIVLSRPGVGTGAVVAPILSADGCIGALSAEIRGGAETSEAIQGLAAIFAAHLAGVLATTPEPAEMPAARAANS